MGLEGRSSAQDAKQIAVRLKQLRGFATKYRVDSRPLLAMQALSIAQFRDANDEIALLNAILTSFSSFACNDQARYTDNPEYLVSCPVSSLRQRDQWPGGHRLVFCPQILCVSLDGVPPVQLARNCAASNVSLRTPCFLNGFHVAAPQIVALITTSSLP